MQRKSLEGTSQTVGRFSIPGAAAYLDCSKSQAEKIIKSGALRSHKDGRRRYVTLAALEEYLRNLDAGC